MEAPWGIVFENEKAKHKKVLGSGDKKFTEWVCLEWYYGSLLGPWGTS